MKKILFLSFIIIFSFTVNGQAIENFHGWSSAKPFPAISQEHIAGKAYVFFKPVFNEDSTVSASGLRVHFLGRDGKIHEAALTSIEQGYSSSSINWKIFVRDYKDPLPVVLNMYGENVYITL